MTQARADSGQPPLRTRKARSGPGATFAKPGATINLNRIAQATGGRVEGDGAFTVAALSALENAASDALSFYADPKREAKLKASGAGAVMLKAEHAGLFAGHKIVVADPYLAYARASALFAPPPPLSDAGVHPSAIIAAGASLHADVAVGAYSVIGENSRLEQGVVVGSHVSVGADCVLGRDTVLDAGVRIYARTTIGERCRLASGAVIGASGFGYAHDPHSDPNSGGEWVRIEQLGGVVIGDDVDIGANTTIDRGALDNTVIGNGVKLDNHIQIAHNVRVGDDTVMAGCVAIAGSATIGKRCRLGGRAAILGHLEIADDVRVNADGFVAQSITEAGVYSSMIPAQPAAQWRKTVANLRRLDRLRAHDNQCNRDTTQDDD